MLTSAMKMESNRCEDEEDRRVALGTGDVFSAILAADAVNNVDFTESVKKASVFIKECIKRSVEMELPLTDGVCFEECLYKLAR